MSHPAHFNGRTASADEMPFKSIQSWKTQHKTPAMSKIGQNDFKMTLNDTISSANIHPDITQNARTALAPSGSQSVRSDGKEPFAFKDIIDIVNPLHHVPVVNMVYRGLTGDEIKPASQIVGGGLYGGPIGAVSGTLSAVSQIKTGQDIAANVMQGFTGSKQSSEINNLPSNRFSFADNPHIPDLPIHAGAQYDTAGSSIPDDPLLRLNEVANRLNKGQNPTYALPDTAISIQNVAEAHHAYQQVAAAQGRTAGKNFKTISLNNADLTNNAPKQDENMLSDLDLDQMTFKRAPITQMLLSAMPPRRAE